MIPGPDPTSVVSMGSVYAGFFLYSGLFHLPDLDTDFDCGLFRLSDLDTLILTTDFCVRNVVA
jgi:hypothetical protein